MFFSFILISPIPLQAYCFSNLSYLSPRLSHLSHLSPICLPPRLLLVSPPPRSHSHHHHVGEARFMVAGGGEVYGGLRTEVTWRLEEARLMAVGRWARLWRRRLQSFFLFFLGLDLVQCNPGWKVLLTSRNEAVTTGILQKDLTCFKVDCLTPQESWTLFRRIAFPKENTNDVNVDVEMEEAGKEIIKHCGGLPLALKVLGGSYEIHIAYAELPIYLKHCFLYLAHFPEDYEINVEILSYYWAAEGIPRPRYYNGASIRDVADGFIEELVERNMVISERDKTSRFTTCRLHDMLREVCLRSGEEENFLQIVDASTAASNENSNSRRLIVHSSDNTCHLDGYLQNPSLRSLLFIQKISSLNWTASGLSFRRLQLMRVLDLSRAEFKGGKLPSSIGKLIHLRYLKNFSTKHTSVDDLQRMTELNTLSILFHCDGCTVETLSTYLGELRHLKNLTIIDKSASDARGFVLDCILLKQLKLSIHMPNLPDEQHFPSRLTTICLRHCLVEEDPMPILEKLLHLKNVELWDQSFAGRRMLCSGGGFTKLHQLELSGLKELEEWIVEEGSMPVLHTLSISHCDNLKELPDGLRFITSLMELSCGYMGSKWEERLTDGGTDYFKVQHIPLLIFNWA
ncbi:hypothetical protein IGI04_034568 [Brassica rapa subsp. trilocularis]|uniref:NB-ARC domain-containing protein n=1 Tax=Brassica rapa subsp. trilocularis TaxID=1813537 RepID=A0ABQ7LCD6_BRACM|nr:hypothetical protein IGI04_034568 [Brassica rapa subsp. trilocularis]